MRFFAKVYEFIRKKFTSVLEYLYLWDLKLREGVFLGKNVKVKGFVTVRNYGGTITIGDEVTIEKNVTFQCFGGKISIGNGVHLGRFCFLNAVTSITIGDHSLIAPFCHFTDRNHGTSRDCLIKYQKGITVPISIGQDVWIGSGCIILKGVNIGDGAVIGAGSVVNRDIAPFSIAVGVPARKIKERV